MMQLRPQPDGSCPEIAPISYPPNGGVPLEDLVGWIVMTEPPLEGQPLEPVATWSYQNQVVKLYRRLSKLLRIGPEPGETHC